MLDHTGDGVLEQSEFHRFQQVTREHEKEGEEESKAKKPET